MKMPRFHYSVAIILTVVIFCLPILVWRNVAASLEAERTLQAYLITLDILEGYLRKHPGKWPTSWEDLKQNSREVSGAGFHWPNDIAEFRARVHVNFGLSREQVATMDVASFSAVRQVGPNFGPHEEKIEMVLKAAVNDR